MNANSIELVGAEKVARAAERFEQSAIRIGQIAVQMEETAQQMESMFIRFVDNLDKTLESHPTTIVNNNAPTAVNPSNTLVVDTLAVHPGQTVFLSYDVRHEDGHEITVTTENIRDMIRNLEEQVAGRDIQFVVLHRGLRIAREKLSP